MLALARYGHEEALYKTDPAQSVKVYIMSKHRPVYPRRRILSRRLLFLRFLAILIETASALFQE
jgi:hypothetical protein